MTMPRLFWNAVGVTVGVIMAVASSVPLVTAFTTPTVRYTSTWTSTTVRMALNGPSTNEQLVSRRQWWSNTMTTTTTAAAAAAATVATTFLQAPSPAFAAEVVPVSLDDALYLILRVREATQQETRLITTGQFKDVQRANVKLAVAMMVNNYRLSDMINVAAAYIPGDSNRGYKAITTGQTAVQSLMTILEYFDSSDVQNLKVRDHEKVCIRRHGPTTLHYTTHLTFHHLHLDHHLLFYYYSFCYCYFFFL